jgi:hypothetical protein
METGNLMIDAQSAFARERRRRRREQLTRRLARRGCIAHTLQSLAQALGDAPPASRRTIGVHPIPLASIVGTAEDSKARDFDSRFRPPSSSRERWQRLWIAARRDAPLPPISVFRLAGRHYVGDGHHRVSVAQALGMSAIDAEVIELGGRPG